MNPADVAGIILFSGIGGSSLGAHQAGITNTVSVEWDAAIAAAANENGIKTVCADIRTLDPEAFYWEHVGRGPEHLFLQASPPCTSFSPAGKQKGRNDLPVLEAILREIGDLPIETVVERIAHYRGRVADECAAETSALSIEPILWIAALVPELISFEQVIQVLPLWEVYAEVLERWGYYTWTGKVSAEQHGVPQTRNRAYLLGSLHGPVAEPPATHSKYYPRNPTKLDEGLPKWISMAEALAVDPEGRLVGTQTPRGETERHSRSTGSPAQTLTRHAGSYRLESHGMTNRPSFTVTGGGTSTGGAEPFARGARDGMKKAIASGEWAGPVEEAA